MHLDSTALQSLITEALDFGVEDIFIKRITNDQDPFDDKAELLLSISRDGESLEEFRHMLAGYDSHFTETGLLASFADDTFMVQVTEK